MVVMNVKLNNDLHGILNIIKGDYILINLHNENDKVGSMELYFRDHKKITLESIYCRDQYRKQGIGKTLLDISDYLLKDYIDYLLLGVYYPCQMIEDIHIYRSNNELDNQARKFYLKNGFNILPYMEYVNNKDMYPLINEKDFSPTIKKYGRSIVYKKIKKLDNYRFELKDNNLYEREYHG